MNDCTLKSGFPGWNETDRLAALRSFGILDSEQEAVFDDITRVLAQACEAPFALISLVDEQRQWFKSAFGLALKETPLDASLCALAILQPGLFTVSDTTQDPRFKNNPLVNGDSGLRFYAGVPLVTDEGLPLGTLCVLDTKPRPNGLTALQADILATLARAVMTEIKLKRSFQTLAERENDFRTFADTLPQMVWSAHPDGYDEYSNAYWHEYTGAAPGASLGKGWNRLLHPNDQDRAWARWQHSFKTGEPYETTYRLLHHSGEYRWILARARPVHSPEGNITRWVGTYTDIHEWKEADRAAAESEERYRALIEANAVVFWIASPDGLITRAWGTAEIGGHPEEAYKGIGWLDKVHPDDRESVISGWQWALASGSIYQSEMRFILANGEYRWMLSNGVPLKNADGTVREWVGSISDIHVRKQAEEKLRESEERLRLAAETTAFGIWDVDLITGQRQWTPEMKAILGYSENVPAATSAFIDRIHADDRARIISMFYDNLPLSDRICSETCRIIRADNGQERWVAVSGRALFDDSGRAVREIGNIQDITERKLSEEALRKSEERLRLALQAGRMFAWEHDLTTNFVTRSENSLDLLGVGSGPLPEFLERVFPQDRKLRAQFSQNIQKHSSDTAEFRYMLPAGGVIWLGSRAEKASPNRVIGVTFDITERKLAEEEVWRAANHDALTGLPNRALFQQRLEQALASAKQNKTSVSLLLIDLDDFKDVNDTLGHDAGDALLKETATRLTEMLRECDTVARFGGDEFAILVVDPLRLEHATRFAEQVLKRLRQPFAYKKRTIASRASIGVAAFPDHHAKPAELVKDADIALYRAKAQGRNRVLTYSPSMRREIEERVTLGAQVREALAQDRIIPYYQPKVCLTSGRITGFEALARWRHPTKGTLTPATFGAAFEDGELATTIRRQMMAHVVADMRRWLAEGLAFGRVAMNLSSADFTQATLPQEILSTFEKAGVPIGLFEVEITETVLLGKSAVCVSAILQQLREAGVQIALDDFGTGYASLMHLKQFPVDHVKIDRTFVKDLERGADDAAIVTAVIGLGRSLGLQVTAEGVETPGQARRLVELGCPQAQGFLYARPAAAADVPLLLAA